MLLPPTAGHPRRRSTTASQSWSPVNARGWSSGALLDPSITHLKPLGRVSPEIGVPRAPSLIEQGFHSRIRAQIVVMGVCLQPLGESRRRLTPRSPPETVHDLRYYSRSCLRSPSPERCAMLRLSDPWRHLWSVRLFRSPCRRICSDTTAETPTCHPLAARSPLRAVHSATAPAKPQQQ